MCVLKLTLGNFCSSYFPLLSAYSVKRSDGHVLASWPLGSVDLLSDSMPSGRLCTTSERELFAFSAKHTHTHFFLPVLSCCVVCVFFRTDPEILAFSTHLFSFPSISFDFPYSLKLWFFLEYWNLWLIMIWEIVHEYLFLSLCWMDITNLCLLDCYIYFCISVCIQLIAVSILASFCVWTKSFKCKDAVNRDSTIQSLQVRRIQVPCQPSDDRAIPSGRPSVHCSIHPDDVSSHPDARQTSIIRPDEVFIPSEPHTVSRSFCANLHPFGRFSSTSGRLPVLDQFLISFQVPRKRRSINRPDDVVSRPDVRLLKARIAIQIWPSGCLTAMVRTHVHQRRKLPIRLQPSGRVHYRYGNYVLKNGRPDAHPPWSERSRAL
jgi:hypothetical protein